IKAPTHGILTAGGIISFIFGSLILFQSPFARVSTSLVVGVGLGSGGFFAFAVAKAVQARMRRAVTGREALIGALAVARTDLDPTGSVFLRGEWWNAIAEGEEVRKGEQVEVIGVDGFQLRVKKVK
ncbi:MAG: NfeD family protein, partial [Anaerolineae bacterium]